MNYPRLFVNGTFSRIIKPIKVSITENIVPLSTASITMPYDERLPSRSWVELFTPYGSAGMYRARSPHNSYGDGSTNTAELEHMISEVGDYLFKEKIYEMMNATTAFKKAFSYYKGNRWKLGDVSALGSTSVAIQVEYDRVLDTLLSILEQKPDCMMAFDFTTSPWTLNVVKRGTTVTAEGRLARNVTKATITYDDSELVTRAWYRTFTKKNGETTAKWTSKDASTKSKYGLIEGVVATSSDMTSTEITNTVNAYIKSHQEPKVNVSIQATALSQITGESMDKFTIGKLFRLNLIDYSVTLEDVITSITWNDPYNNPNDVTVVLGKEEDTVVTYLHNLDATGSGGGGGGGGAKKKEEEKWKEYYTTFEQTDYRISMTANKVDKASNILEQAGMELNSKGVLLYATDAKNGNLLTSKIKVAADKVSSEVKNAKTGLESKISQTAYEIRAEVKSTKTGLESKITQTASQIRSEVTNTANGLQSQITQNAGQIELKVSKNGVVSAINQTAETIKISASKIQLDGTTIANLIKTTEIQVSALEVTNGCDLNSVDCGAIDCTYLNTNAGDIDCGGKVTTDSLKVGSYNATWKSKTVVTGIDRSASRNFVYAVNGNISNLSTIVGTLCTGVSSDAIYYLGR